MGREEWLSKVHSGFTTRVTKRTHRIIEHVDTVHPRAARDGIT